MLTVVEMTSVALSAEQQKLIETISKENGFTDYQVKAISGSAKGDNYLGVITSVTIEDGNNKLELILKSAHVGEIRNQMPIHKAYMREIFVYEQVFAKFKKFQEEYRISEPFQSYPKLYGTCDTESSECLVMENLRESGYKLWNRKLPMNPEHLTAVMKEYAKLHAVSLAMKEKQPEAFKELTKDMGKHTFADDVEDRGKAAAYVSSVMGNIWGAFEHDPVTTEVLKGFEKRLPDMFTELTTLSDEPVVIDHGDCWCNNLLFSYKNEEDPTAPSDVRLIDWQISKTASPALDLVYFFLVHSPKEILYDYESYLKLYHATLSKNLREFSCEAEKVFPYSTLLQHWNRKAKIGLYMSFMVLKLMLCDSEEAPDFSEISDSGKGVLSFFDFATKATGTFETRIRDLVEFCIAMGYV